MDAKDKEYLDQIVSALSAIIVEIARETTKTGSVSRHNMALKLKSRGEALPENLAAAKDIFKDIAQKLDQ